LRNSKIGDQNGGSCRGKEEKRGKKGKGRPNLSLDVIGLSNMERTISSTRREGIEGAAFSHFGYHLEHARVGQKKFSLLVGSLQYVPILHT